VHVLAQGQIVVSGGRELALRLESEGYAPILREAGLEPDASTEEGDEGHADADTQP
jgi:hypothetical protein